MWHLIHVCLPQFASAKDLKYSKYLQYFMFVSLLQDLLKIFQNPKSHTSMSVCLCRGAQIFKSLPTGRYVCFSAPRSA